MARKTRCRLSVSLTAALFGVSMICSGFLAPMQVHAEETSKVTSTEELTTFMDVIKRDGQTGHSEYSVSVFTEAKNGISFLIHDRKGSGTADNQDETEEKVSEAFANVAMTTLTGDDYLNIRVSPDIDAELAGKLYAGGTAEVVEVDEDEGWTHIISGSVDGWVSNEYIVTGLEAEKLAFEVCDQIATVQADGLKVRETADPEGAVMNVVYQNETYKVLERQDEWVKIETSAGSGYAAAEFVSVELKTGKAISIEEELEAIRIQQEKEAEEARRAEEERARRAAEQQQQAAAQQQAANNQVSVPTTTGPATSASVDDAYLLACICRVEAGSYDGMLAVANVVLNRVNSGSFPGSISGVIYQSGQFAVGGTFQSYLANGPGGTAIQAANDALAGVNNVGGYLYFRSASSANTASYSSYTIIGGNCFYQR